MSKLTNGADGWINKWINKFNKNKIMIINDNDYVDKMDNGQNR